MESSRDELLAFLHDFDLNRELNSLAEEEVREWIFEEWEELKRDNISPGEATSIIIDSNHKWMSLSPDNKIFVYSELLKLNDAEQIKSFLIKEIENTNKLIFIELKSKQPV